MNSLLERVDSRVYVAATLLAWGAALILLGLVRFDTYGIDEGAARALLLNWSVSDQIAHPIVVFGMPDFRALLFVPLGLYWPGSVVAAKVFSILVTFGAIVGLYRWSLRTASDEIARIGAGLMLVAPFTLMQLDALGTAPYLLALFAVGALVDTKYRAQERNITGLFFAHMLLIATMLTLHPAGLAYPLALAWRWKQDPSATPRQKTIWAGLAFTVVAIIAMQAGWVALDWFANPLPALGTALLGIDPHTLEARSVVSGLVPFIVLIMVIIGDRKFLARDLLGGTLALAVVLGALAADAAWAMLALTLILFRGTPLLIELNGKLRGNHWFAKRGLVMVALMLIATLFMQIDVARRQVLALELLAPVDELLRELTVELEGADDKTRIATQWPGRTMLATRHAALPLPPPKESAEQFLAQIKGITHFVFAHNDPRNSALARNIADIGGATETAALQPGGVIVRIRPAPPAAP